MSIKKDGSHATEKNGRQGRGARGPDARSGAVLLSNPGRRSEDRPDHELGRRRVRIPAQPGADGPPHRAANRPDAPHQPPAHAAAGGRPCGGGAGGIHRQPGPSAIEAGSPHSQRRGALSGVERALPGDRLDHGRGARRGGHPQEHRDPSAAQRRGEGAIVALGSTIYRADLSVSDLDRQVYGRHALTLARHPSETEERLMVRLLAFALHSDEALEFGRGLSAEGEPDLIRRDPTGTVDLWIEVGLPDERDVRKACGRARQVAVLAYGARKVENWWSDNAAAFMRQSNLRVLTLTGAETAALQTLAARSMSLTCTVQEQHVWLASATSTIELDPLLRGGGEGR